MDKQTLGVHITITTSVCVCVCVAYMLHGKNFHSQGYNIKVTELLFCLRC